MATELENFIEKVSNVPEWEIGNENDENISKIIYALLNSYRGEELKRPDGYYINDDSCYIIEHFEFDSSEPIAGSQNRRELDRADKYLKDNVIFDTVCRQSLNCDYKYQFYKTRLETTFTSHYKNINAYKNIIRERVSLDNLTIKTVFCIEDTSALGSVYYDDERKLILAPTYCLSFIKLFENSPNLDIVITYSEVNSTSKIVTLLDRNNLQYYKEKALRDEDIKLINWNVNIASFSTIIP